jgi:hypothetical protein
MAAILYALSLSHLRFLLLGLFLKTGRSGGGGCSWVRFSLNVNYGAASDGRSVADLGVIFFLS